MSTAQAAKEVEPVVVVAADLLEARNASPLQQVVVVPIGGKSEYDSYARLKDGRYAKVFSWRGGSAGTYWPVTGLEFDDGSYHR